MFRLHYCDYDVSESNGSRIYRPNGSGDYLFLYFMTPMKLYKNHKLELTRPGACILYTPDFFQHYEAVREFKNSYLHFESDHPNFPSHYQIPENVVFYPHQTEGINQLIRQIQAEYLTRSSYYEEQISNLLCQLFITLSRDLRQSTRETETAGLYQQFQKSRYTILSHCDQKWNSESMAALVNLSRSQFYSYYTHFFHRPPKSDLIEARIEKAKTLLTNEALQIQDVAEMCGFSNISHFTRYFKKQCGCTPREFGRKKKNGGDILSVLH